MHSARDVHVRTLGLIAPLLLVLAFAVALAAQALTETRLRRQAARRTLADYADFAAFIIQNAARQELDRRVAYAFTPLRRYDPASGEPFPPPAALGGDRFEAQRCTEDGITDPTYVRIDAAQGHVDVAGSPIDAELRAWLADTLGALAQGDRSYGQLFTGRTDPRVLAWSALRDSTGHALALYALEHCLSIGGTSIFAIAVSATPALPPALTAGVPADSQFSIRVTDPRGDVLFATPGQYPASIVGEGPAVAELGGLRMTLHIRPEVADRLVSSVPYGGPPRALFLLLMIASFAAIAVFQVRRQQQLVRLRENFVASVSHELRTPLQQILVFSQLLRMEKLTDPAERRHSIAVVEREAGRLMQLVENILQFSRSARGEEALRRETVRLADIVRETVAGFQAVAESSHVSIEVNGDGDIDAHADADAVRRVLLNILDNAVKYGPRGQAVTVTVTSCDGRPQLIVDDQGPGIPSRERERVWRPFERLGADGVTGSGIGLAIVRDLVQRMDGAVHIGDAPGGGARFSIELPPVEGA